MPIHEILGIASGILAFATIIPYVWDIVGGITKPNTVTYFVWTLLQSIALTAQIKVGASWSLYLLIGITINCGICFLFSLSKKYGYKEYGTVDTIALILAGISIAVLIFTDHPVLAILIPLVGDAIGAIPTLVKTRKYPHTEQRLAWFMMVLASALGVMATEKLDFANLAYPIFLLFESLIIFGLAFFTKRTLICRWGRGCV